jgi:hypothetical protein
VLARRMVQFTLQCYFARFALNSRRVLPHEKNFGWVTWTGLKQSKRIIRTTNMPQMWDVDLEKAEVQKIQQHLWVRRTTHEGAKEDTSGP